MPRRSERRDQLHQRLDVAAHHAVARFHALDGGQRQARGLRERALVDAGERARARSCLAVIIRETALVSTLK
jgi:hypothetical protein